MPIHGEISKVLNCIANLNFHLVILAGVVMTDEDKDVISGATFQSAIVSLKEGLKILERVNVSY
jgi:hypothetical protein